MLLLNEKKNKMLSPLVATIGNFDGLHLGHQNLLMKVVERARALRYIPAVFTFEPLPKQFFSPQNAPFRLSTLRQKMTLFTECGIEQVICLRFRHIFNLEASLFIERYLYKWNVQHLIVGEDFRFGYQQKGDVGLLKKQKNLLVEALSLSAGETGKISSSLVRSALLNGDLNQVTQLLGRPFSVTGRVVHGAKRGSVIGFPTANIPLISARKLLRGVFLTRVRVEGETKSFQALTNVGTRPTVDGKQSMIETHLLAWHGGELYGRRLTIEFIKKIREERKFGSLEALRQQITRDLSAVLEGMEC